MASEIILRDQNFVTVLAGVTDDASQEIRMLRVDPVTGRLKVSSIGSGSGTVTEVSVVTANGFAGTVADDTTTPAITLTTTVTGVLKGNGTAISAAVANTDYQIPIVLTTTGSSGAATFDGTTLNIPQYTGGGGGTVDSVVGTANRITVDSTDPANPIVDISASYVGQASITTLGTIATGTWQGTSISTTYTDAKIKTVTGTADRITVGGTATDPTFDIAATYVGQNTITTLGTVATGTWNATVISLAKGGTGAALVDPNADKILAWDDTDGSVGFWTLGSGLSYDHATHTLSAAGSSGIVVGTTTVTSGTNGRVLYDNSGVVGEYTVTGTAGSVVLSTSPSITTPKIITGVTDTNGNTLWAVTATASAVNYLTYANAATGNNPQWTASGSDSNIGIKWNSKGTGYFTMAGGSDGSHGLLVLSQDSSTTQGGIDFYSAFTSDPSVRNWAIIPSHTAYGDLAIRVSSAQGGNPHTAGVTAVQFDKDANSKFSGFVKSSSASSGIGYATGAGSTVTQATSKSTGVTINAICGQITMNGATLNAGAAVTFVVTNSAVASTDVIVVNLASGNSVTNYHLDVQRVNNGSFQLTLHNYGGSNLAELPVINFAVIKAVTS